MRVRCRSSRRPRIVSAVPRAGTVPGDERVDHGLVLARRNDQRPAPAAFVRGRGGAITRQHQRRAHQRREQVVGDASHQRIEHVDARDRYYGLRAGIYGGTKAGDGPGGRTTRRASTARHRDLRAACEQRAAACRGHDTAQANAETLDVRLGQLDSLRVGRRCGTARTSSPVRARALRRVADRGVRLHRTPQLQQRLLDRVRARVDRPVVRVGAGRDRVARRHQLDRERWKFDDAGARCAPGVR